MFLPSERRSSVRIQTAASAILKNLTKESQAEPAVILDVSTGGMRLESSLQVTLGDAVQVELPDSVLLAEVVYSHDSIIGIKLCHSLSRAILLRCVQPELWAEHSDATSHAA